MALQPTILGAGGLAPPQHYMDWTAVIAGALVATAVAVVMFSFGTAIGLSIISPYEGEGASAPAWFAILGLWTLWVVCSSFMAGGYVTGRMRRRIGDATEHESDVRDGTHGLVVWATGIVLASWLLTLGVTGLVGTAAKAGAAAGGAASAASDANNRTAFTVDSLFRAPTQRSQVTATNSPASPAQAADAGTAENVRPRNERAASARGEAQRLLTYGLVKGDLTADNKAAMVRLVSDQTGMSPAESEQRVNQVIADTKKAADKARKAGILIAFFTAAALLIGAAAAAWAATLGGRHRDQNVDHSHFWRWTN